MMRREDLGGRLAHLQRIIRIPSPDHKGIFVFSFGPIPCGIIVRPLSLIFASQEIPPFVKVSEVPGNLAAAGSLHN